PTAEGEGFGSPPSCLQTTTAPANSPPAPASTGTHHGTPNVGPTIPAVALHASGSTTGRLRPIRAHDGPTTRTSTGRTPPGGFSPHVTLASSGMGSRAIRVSQRARSGGLGTLTVALRVNGCS